MTTRSGDNPTVTLFSSTSTQWRRAILATVAVSRFRKSLCKSATGSHQGLGGSAQLDPDIQKQNGSPSENGDIVSQASEEANQAVLDKALKYTNPEVEALRLIRDDSEKQLDANGLVLVLLAGITFIAILQPPGSFDNGKLQESVLVSLFMLLATLSFFIACTGLGAVVVGSARLFRPYFNPKLRTYLFLSDIRDNVDNVDVLANLCVENVYRIKRIRIYLGVSLVLCIAAYICGALAVMLTNDSQRYMLIVAMAVGGVILLCEICTTVSISSWKY